MRSLGPTARPGASLVEMLVAVVLFGIVAGAVLRALDRQARLHDALLALLESRVAHAATHESMAVMLRSVSPTAGDVERLSDSAMAYRLPIGGGVACGLIANRVILAPDSITGGQVLASLREWPQAGDSLWILDEGPTDATIDDAWRGERITAAGRVGGACAGSPLLAAGDAARTAWVFDLASALAGSPGLGAGSAVRLTRRARFALYRSGTESWLGFSEWNAGNGTWNVIQPLSGPYRPYDAAVPAASGLAIAPHDGAGVTAWAFAGFPWSVGLATRTRTRAISLAGSRRVPVDDSLHTVIGLRNAR